MTKTYKVLAALLGYPTGELIEALPELRSALESDRKSVRPEEALGAVSKGESPNGPAYAGIERLLSELEESDIYDLQERYVDLFDRVPSLSLNLFEHIHGQTRDRGQAMVDLRQVYARHGFTQLSGELPDYLPAFLEFLSLIDGDEARELLAETSEILKGIGARLDKRGSSYCAVFEALLVLAGEATWRRDSVSDEEIRAEDDPAVLDASWAEEPAFGSPATCGAHASQPQVAAIQFHGRRPDGAAQPTTTAIDR